MGRFELQVECSPTHATPINKGGQGFFWHNAFMPHKIANTKLYKLSPQGRQIKAVADRITKTGLPDDQVNIIIDVLTRHGGSDSGMVAFARIYEQGYIDYMAANALHVGAHNCLANPKEFQDEVRRRGKMPARELLQYLNLE